MKNREWLMNMALIDMLDMFRKNSNSCAFKFLSKDTCMIRKFRERCGKHKNNCYNCIAAWLNEEKE